MSNLDETHDGPDTEDHSNLTETTAPPPSSLDTSIEGYKILRELHRGGQGVVYEAFEQSTKRKVAIKLLLGGRHASKTAQKRFEREIELVAQLRHPNIIAIFSSGETTDGLLYYAMDYVRGTTIDAYVRDKGPTLEELLTLFADVCDAVQYAHQRAVIHRDLKPGNVLVDADGAPKILDFGLAKLMAGATDTVLSMTEQVMGTLRYMSPEQAAGSHDETDTRTDVYSLGVMLYELLTGSAPYPVDGRLDQILSHITETPPKTPTSQWDVGSGVTRRSSKKVRDGECPIDQDVQTIVLKCLAKERDRRYQSAGELARDLRHYVAGEAIEARRDSSIYVLRTTLRRFVRRHQLALSLALLAAILVVGGLGWLRYKTLRDRELAQAENRSRAEVIVREAVALQSDDPEGAEQRFESALLYDPESFKALGNLAILKKDTHFRSEDLDSTLGQLEESNVLCDRALAIQPDHPGLWNVKCVVLYSLNRLEEAETACRRAITARSEYFPAYNNLAKVLVLQGRLDDALEAETTSIRMAREHNTWGKTWEAAPWRALGAIQMLTGQPEARRSLEKALEFNSMDPWARVMLARLLLTDPAQIDPREALKNVEVAHEIASVRDARMKQIMAHAFLENERYDDAIRHADECVRLDVRNATCHLIAALALVQRSAPEDVAGRFDAAMAVWPSFDGRDLRVNADRGVIWYERASELRALCERAADAVGRDCGH